MMKRQHWIALVLSAGILTTGTSCSGANPTAINNDLNPDPSSATVVDPENPVLGVDPASAPPASQEPLTQEEQVQLSELAFASATSGVTLSVTPVTATPGAQITVTWSAIPTALVSNGNWLGLYRKGDPQSAYITKKFLNCSTSTPGPATASRSCNFRLPTQPGEYVVRLYRKNLKLLAKSSIVNAATTAPPVLPELVLAGGNFGPSTTQALRIPTSETTAVAGDGVGAFRIACNFSHAAFDDPVVYPGQPGVSHLHMFYGNTGVNAFSTAASIANTGASTCPGGILNRSGYWLPALFDTSGRALIPTANFYYKRGYNGVPANAIINPPMGLRMIAGNSMSTTPANAPQSWQSRIKWDCEVNGIHGPQGSTIPACAQGNRVWFSVQFPQCWDGVNLDSADHRSHMAYPFNGCPASHPVAIPEITLTGTYVVITPGGTEGWRLSSDMYPISSTNRGGASNHADWVNGWDPAISQLFVSRCINQSRDCHNELLGDGTRLVRQ